MRVPIRVWLVLAGCLGLAVLAGCKAEKPQPLHSDVLAKSNLQYYWRLSLRLGADETIVRLDRLDENLYCLTSQNRLIAIDAGVGRYKWSQTIENASTTVFRPTHADQVKLSQSVTSMKEVTSGKLAEALTTFDAVLINTLSTALVLDRQSGQVYRDIPFDFAANTTGVSDGELFFVGSTKGWYYAFRLQEAVKAWWLSADEMITSPIVLFDGHVYVADDSGGVIATKIDDKHRKVWTQRLESPITARFHVDRRGCFVPCDDNRLYALDLSQGELMWDQPFVCQGPLRDDLQATVKTLFQYARGDKFYAIDPATGQQRWSRPDGREVLAVSDGQLFVLNDANTLLVIDEMSGKVSTSMPMTGWDLFAPNTSTAAIYTATSDGKLACIRGLDAGHLTPELLKGTP